MKLLFFLRKIYIYLFSSILFPFIFIHKIFEDNIDLFIEVMTNPSLIISYFDFIDDEKN